MQGAELEQHCTTYPLYGILVTAIFGNQLPQYVTMAIPGSSHDTRPATLHGVRCRRVRSEQEKGIAQDAIDGWRQTRHEDIEIRLLWSISASRNLRQPHIPHWQRVGSLCASSPAPALPPASRGNMPAESSPGHPIWNCEDG